jgi:ABC-type multidrug transport system fused ATPase/permease subunit
MIVVLMLLENALALCTPWFGGQLTSTILAEGSVLTFTYKQILLLWFCLVIIQASLGYVNRIVSGRAGERMLLQLRTSLYNKLQSLPLTYHHDKRHGETLALITNDSAIVSSFITGTLVSIVPQIITAFGAILCIFIINPTVAVFATVLIPLFYIVIKLLSRNIRPLSKKLMQQYASTFSLAEENLLTLPVIKIFAREPLESKRFSNSNEELFSLSTQYIKTQSHLSPVIKILSTGIVLTVLWIIGDDIAAGTLSTAEMVSLMLYGMLLTRPISMLADTYGQIQRTSGAADRLIEIYNQPSEDCERGIALPPVKGQIQLENVSFAYPGRETILHNLALQIDAGETIAITGDNGAGKSTLAHLLMRLISPDSGSIKIDGYHIEDVSLSSLRSQIGLVQQNIFLQNATVADNIRFGRPGASDNEIIAAATASHALAFINNLPLGFNTLIGDQGVKLSGGQKQRLSLARALITHPAILILDEATAMFDPDGELAFIEENKDLLKNRTVIIITHRPASLALADRILRLDNGAISTVSCSPLAQF